MVEAVVEAVEEAVAVVGAEVVVEEAVVEETNPALLQSSRTQKPYACLCLNNRSHRHSLLLLETLKCFKWRVLEALVVYGCMRSLFLRIAAGGLAIVSFATLLIPEAPSGGLWFGGLMGAYAVLGDRLGGKWTKPS